MAVKKPESAGAESKRTLGDAILDAALLSFDSYGWRGTSVEKVAEIAGVPLEQVITEYPSREYLAAAIFRRILELLPAELADEIDESSPLRARLYALTAHELRLLDAHKGFIREIWRESVNPFTPLAIQQIPHIHRFLSLAAEQVATARARGEVGPFAIPSAAALAFWVVHLRILWFWLDDRTASSAATHARADRWLGQLVATLGGREPAERAAD